ncbi:unannotated protein [freshwater metagenome]|uniref:Unannotated protein n=1 Tax=freshwater metagenome TaxID=449393 RepID=A0A6J6MVB8_9ZZZZ
MSVRRRRFAKPVSTTSSRWLMKMASSKPKLSAYLSAVIESMYERDLIPAISESLFLIYGNLVNVALSEISATGCKVKNHPPSPRQIIRNLFLPISSIKILEIASSTSIFAGVLINTFAADFWILAKWRSQAITF